MSRHIKHITMKKIIFFIIPFLLLASACSSDEGNEVIEPNISSSNKVRFEVTLDGSDEAVVSYSVKRTTIELVAEERITITEDWSKTITVEEDFNFIDLSAVNAAFEGKITVKIYVGDKLAGSDSDATIAVAIASLIE